MVNEKTYRPLNKNQLHTLLLLYKFRYATVPLLTEYEGLKSENTPLRNLNLLLEQGYIGRTYDLSYKIDRKAAYWYLTKKGIGVLSKDPRFHPDVLHALYKSSSLSDDFKQHCVDTLAVFNALRLSYGDAYHMFTKQELMAADDFPATKPDLYLRGANEYFITLAHDALPFVTKKRLAEYIDHSEDEGWESGAYPSLLFVFAAGSQEKRFLAHARQVLESAGIDSAELSIGTTTLRALLAAPRTSRVWTFVGESANPVALA